MKRILLSLSVLAMVFTTQAQTKKIAKEQNDSLRLIELQEVEVTATRAVKTMPVAFANIGQEQIEKNNYGLDIPSILSSTPSLVAVNSNGIGIGSTSVRMRGTAPTRLNVTINGVSMNNADSHEMYWYDTPDLVSSIGSIQVQRGAGISTNGTGSFGGAINMTTDALTTEFEGDASLSYGSYNTNKQSVHVSSGLMGGHWTVDARLSHIGSDGYVERGSTDLKSYMLQAGYYSGNTMLKLLSFGGKAKTYLLYDGVTKEDMKKYGRRYHTSGQYETSNGPYVLEDGTHVNYYDDHTDNYLQINNQLVLNHRFNKQWTLNATAFYTYGYGYYKQYKGHKKLMEYLNIPDDIAYDSEGNKVRKDLIREKLMRNHLGGFNAAAHYTSERLALSFGGSYSFYACPHWGELDWVDGVDMAKIGEKWYENDVNKHDANIFARANWQVANGLNLFADLQYRLVNYHAWGVNDNYVDKSTGMQPISVDKTYHFFNPHVGVNYTLKKHHNFYFSFAIAQKEPTRGDYTDRYLYAHSAAGISEYPTSEKLFDYELGYNFTAKNFTAGINFYYMKYDNQLVPTGYVNDNYDPLNTNVKDSYRRGIELNMLWNATKWLTLTANATFSQNRVENYTNYISEYRHNNDYSQESSGYNNDDKGEYMGTTRLSYSPKTIANVNLDFHHKGFSAVFTTQYVSKQYFTNYENPEMALDAYCVTNLNLGYTLKTKRARSVHFGVMIFNLFDAVYEGNGYGWSSSDKNTDTNKVEITHNAFYYPQAPIHAMANVTVKF